MFMPAIQWPTSGLGHRLARVIASDRRHVDDTRMEQFGKSSGETAEEESEHQRAR
jgi:hypothetical protein